ncbi:MAG TPA: hydrolase [Legionella sp.]|nr:hydrolase [Legionella sp.]
MVSKLKEELKRIREQEEHSKIMAENNKLAQERLEAQNEVLQKKNKKGRTVNRSGAEVTLWDEALQKAEEAINAEVMAYNDWRAAMMGLLTLYSSLNKAINNSFDKFLTKMVYHKLQNKLLYPLKDVLFNKLRGTPEIDIPALEHFVDLTEDGKLDIQLTRADHGAEKGVLDKLFATGVTAWLAEVGYTPDPQDGDKFLNEWDEPLTKEAFRNLKENGNPTLNDFLSRNNDIQLTPVGLR